VASTYQAQGLSLGSMKDNPDRFLVTFLTPFDRLSCLVVRVPGCRTEMHCVSCEVRTEFIYGMFKNVDRLCGLVVRVPGYRSRGPGSISGTTRFSEK
jgi:hypothetical protein